MIDLDFEFSAKLWEWHAKGDVRAGSWHFVTLPKDISDDIKAFTKHRKTGFGSVRVTVKIGETKWKTSLFPSKEKAAYLLPVKKSVRTTENLSKTKNIDVSINIAL